MRERKRHWPRLHVAVAVAAAIAAGFTGRAQSPAAGFVITNVRVFDGNRVHARTFVAVENGLIRAVGGDMARWRDLRAIDGTGATLVPGFIDSHVHVRDADDLRQALRFGVTAVLEMGAAIPEQQLFDLRTVAKTATDMTDLRTAGFVASARADNRRPVGSTVSTIDDARQFVATRRSQGSDYLKLVLNGVRTAAQGAPNLGQATAKALVDEAHARGMLAVAHVETLPDVRTALSANVDGLAHAWRVGGADPAIARRIAERGAFVSPTLVIPDGYLDGRASLLADSRLRRAMSSEVEEHLRRPLTPLTAGSSESERRASFDAHLDAVRSLHQAGAILLVGTDASPNVAVGTPAAHGISLHRELELLTRAGLSPGEALRTATANAARAFRLTDRGRIEAGRRGDMVLVRGDPTSDITATRDILRVWKAGVELERPMSGSARER